MMMAKPKLGHYCMVDWMNEAKEYVVGYDFLKQIVHFNNGYVFKREPYSQESVNELVMRKIPMVDLTVGQEVPRGSILVPRTESVLGSILLHNRLPH